MKIKTYNIYPEKDSIGFYSMFPTKEYLEDKLILNPETSEEMNFNRDIVKQLSQLFKTQQKEKELIKSPSSYNRNMRILKQ